MAPRGARAQPLLGGYKVHDQVFFTGVNQTFPNGDKLVHGQQGEVSGPGTGDEVRTHVAVRFPGNKSNVECYLTEVRRLRSACPPVLAGHRLTPPRSARAEARGGGGEARPVGGGEGEP